MDNDASEAIAEVVAALLIAAYLLSLAAVVGRAVLKIAGVA